VKRRILRIVVWLGPKSTNSAQQSVGATLRRGNKEAIICASRTAPGSKPTKWSNNARATRSSVLYNAKVRQRVPIVIGLCT